MRGPALAGALLSLALLGGCVPTSAAPDGADAYLDAAAYGQGFLAVGTGGRLDLIGADGACQSLDTGTGAALTAVAVHGDEALAVGVDGIVVYLSADGTVASGDTLDGDLYACCFFGGGWLAGGEGGLSYSTDLAVWQSTGPDLEGAVTGLAATQALCVGVTDRGEAFASTDGAAWTVLDYNGYYDRTASFWGVEACGEVFWAHGEDRDGNAILTTSVSGSVWSDRAVMVGDEPADLTVTALCWDGEQVIAACADGQALTLPSCSVCNKLQPISDRPLCAAAYQDGKLLFAGQGFTFELVETQRVRQYRVKAEAALSMQRDGALIIDVRSQADYDQRHIADSAHLDVDQVAQELPTLCPDRARTLIFYCQSGVRSQRALETAQELGYTSIYDLGGIDGWPYRFEGGIS